MPKFIDSEPEVTWAEIMSTPGPMTEDERMAMACAWSDYRAEYGVSADDHVRSLEHQAFKAGFEAALNGSDRGVLR